MLNYFCWQKLSENYWYSRRTLNLFAERQQYLEYFSKSFCFTPLLNRSTCQLECSTWVTGSHEKNITFVPQKYQNVWNFSVFLSNFHPWMTLFHPLVKNPPFGNRYSNVWHCCVQISNGSQCSDIPVHVAVQLNILHLANFDSDLMEYSIDVEMKLTWFDLRLANSYSQPIRIRELPLLQRIWRPDPYIVNSKHSHFHKVRSLF